MGGCGDYVLQWRRAADAVVTGRGGRYRGAGRRRTTVRYIAIQVRPRAFPGFFIGGRPKGRKSRPKADSGEGQQAPPHQLGGLWSAVSSTVGFGPRPPKCFPLFSALRMASPDSIIVDYRAAIGGKIAVPLLVYARGYDKHLLYCCGDCLTRRRVSFATDRPNDLSDALVTHRFASVD